MTLIPFNKTSEAPNVEHVEIVSDVKRFELLKEYRQAGPVLVTGVSDALEQMLVEEVEGDRRYVHASRLTKADI
jgi:hypothetical protein